LQNEKPQKLEGYQVLKIHTTGGKGEQLFVFIHVSQAQVKPSSCTGKRK